MLKLKNTRVLVIAAHPDDELLGAGATMHKLISEHNCKVKVVILSEGLTSRSNKKDREKWTKQLKVHKKNIHAAQKVIGYEAVKIYDFPDNRFDSVNLLDIVKVVEKEKKEFQPEIIFTHHRGDLNIDHRKTFEAVITASRPLEDEIVNTIITFETPSSTEWETSDAPSPYLPNLFFEISKQNLDAKITGMECYKYEKRKFPHPRAPESLEIRAKYWGIIIGKKYAEAFMLVRKVI